MKRALLFGGLIIFGLAPLGTYAATETITAFDVVATMNRGNDLLITEQISYDFGDQQKHGIYRYIPRYLVVNHRKIDMGLHWLGVLQDGTEAIRSEDMVQDQAVIKVGDPNTTISGEHEYRLTYSVGRLIVDTPVGQRLSWNVTGDQWPASIKTSTFIFDGPVAPKDVRCFIGMRGSTSTDCTVTSSGTKIMAQINKPLEEKEGWTVEAMYPEGVFIPAGKQTVEWLPWLRPWMIFTGIFSLIWLMVWRKFGRDPKGRGTIIAEYDPPSQLKPYEVNALDRDGGDHRALVASILDLAQRGVITLTLSNEGKTYRIERNRGAEKGLDPYEVQLITFLFCDGDEFQLMGTSMERTRAYQAMRTAMDGALVNKDLHLWNVSTARVIAFFAVASSWFVGYYLTSAYFQDEYLWLSVIGLAVGIGCAYYMPKRTKNGALQYERIQGFKEYIHVAEKDRLAFHEAPQRTPERFSALLPYAVALGVEEAWGKMFKDILMPSDQMGAHTAMLSASQITGMAHQMNGDMRSLAIAHTSSGGGGGSSGGGGGGGGGGSW